MNRAADLVIAIPLLVILSPLLAALAVAVRLTSRGPAFHRTRRAGLGGRLFTMYKLRTMRAGASREGPAITGESDPRVTRLGRALRSSRLDELPQLWNVVRGDMSVVGPRPEDPRFVAAYTPEQRRILSVRPGITGPAQLAFRDEAALLDPADPEGSYARDVLPAKLAVDLDYVRRRSLPADLAIIARTIGLAIRR